MDINIMDPHEVEAGLNSQQIPEFHRNSGEFDQNVITIRCWSPGHLFLMKLGLLYVKNK